MNKLQELILMIAKDIAKICDENYITYYLEGGSLLGAVRHKGFIPWDDDFDIFMKRKDYIKFLEVCERCLDKEKYFIQNELTEEKYAFSFTKIQLKGTEIIEDFSKDVDIQHGIFVDIFPYDNIPDNKYKRKIFLFKNHMLKNLLWVKCGYGTDKHKKQIKYSILKILGIPFSIKYLKKKRHKLITKYNDIATMLSCNSDYPKVQKSNIVLKKVKMYEFEDTKFYGVADANLVLTEQYGDYMKLPPKEERRQHSNYEINYGKY